MSAPSRRDLEKFIDRMNQLARSNKSALDHSEDQVARQCGLDLGNATRRHRIDSGSRKVITRDIGEHVLAQDITLDQPYFLEDRTNRRLYPR